MTLTDQDLVADLQSVADEVGRTPTMSEYNTLGITSARTVVQRFGTWSDAHRAAGLRPRECNNQTADTGARARYQDLSWDDLEQPAADQDGEVA